jgi:hypothetical protein
MYTLSAADDTYEVSYVVVDDSHQSLRTFERLQTLRQQPLDQWLSAGYGIEVIMPPPCEWCPPVRGDCGSATLYIQLGMFMKPNAGRNGFQGGLSHARKHHNSRP